MNRDFAEMLSALSAAGARFLIVGAHALAAHGAPRATSADDLSRPDTVFQIGLPPSRIDILSISGVDFDCVWEHRVHITIGDLEIGVIGREDFIANKTATGRPKDLLDLALLPPR